jgi:hypothetical protein
MALIYTPIPKNFKDFGSVELPEFAGSRMLVRIAYSSAGK